MAVQGSRKKRRARNKKKKELLKQQEIKVKAALEKQQREKNDNKDEEVGMEPLAEEMEQVLEDVFKKYTKPKTKVIVENTQESAFQAEFSSVSKDMLQDKAEKEKSVTKEADVANAKDKVLSNKQKKKLRRLKIAELKQFVTRPDLVEEHDCNAADPRLLIFLKCQRNTIPVPEHWGRKRKYLQGKRGFEKPPFELPAFIKNTGITAIRDEQLRIYSEKTRKQKQRSQRSGAKGKMAIEYQTLHDAFFVHQSKPPLTTFGDCYYEQKEKEMKFRMFQPGKLSDRLKKALAMPATWRVISPSGIPVYDDLEEEKPREGQILAQGTELSWDETSADGKWIKIVRPVNGWIQCKDDSNKVYGKQVEHNCPTPWLIAQQRFGPPPAYPDLKIPGLNSPIPTGHEYGYDQGQWGKPPIGRDGRPLYGNPFDIFRESDFNSLQPKMHWGDLEEVSDEESSEEEEESSDEEEEEVEEGIRSTVSGTGTESGLDTGLNTATSMGSRSADEINLRKKGTDTADSEKSLFQRVPERSTTGSARGFFPSAKKYDINTMEAGKDEQVGFQQGVDVALDPEDMDNEQKLKRKFEDAIADTADLPIPKRRKGSRFDRGRDKEYDVKF